MSEKPNRHERIAVARRDFVVRAQEDRERLVQSLQRWLERAEDERDVIRAIAHRLRGTAGSYGFVASSNAAAKLDMLCQENSSAGDVADVARQLIRELENMQADRPS